MATPKLGNKKLAVLVGCNYPNTRLKLRSCINDVVAMKEVLETIYGFDRTNIKVLIDEPVQGIPSSEMPTGANIKAALNKMVGKAEAGEANILFFQFSGHGQTVPSLEPGGSYEEGEAIVPCDLNLITDMDFRQLIRRLPQQSSFTILADSCHSGGLIDKKKEQIGHSTVRNVRLLPDDYDVETRGIPIETIHQCLQSVSSISYGVSKAMPIGSLLNYIFKDDASIKFRPDDQHEKDSIYLTKSLSEDEGILLSACQANEKAKGYRFNENGVRKWYGAFTYFLVQILKERKQQQLLQKGENISNRQIVMEARKRLADYGFTQHPCLYCSDGNANAPFLG